MSGKVYASSLSNFNALIPVALFLVLTRVVLAAGLSMHEGIAYVPLIRSVLDEIVPNVEGAWFVNSLSALFPVVFIRNDYDVPLPFQIPSGWPGIFGLVFPLDLEVPFRNVLVVSGHFKFGRVALENCSRERWAIPRVASLELELL